MEETNNFIRFRFFHPKALWIGYNEVLNKLPSFVYEK